ncbi:MAG: NAD(P)-dependent oxidoreductase [Actinomycetota bacterium]|nr:NAD(P)-dependent oxidoreductase [Actinomycetota bacterium]
MAEIEKNGKIGLIGTGLMGAPIATRLAQEGFSVSVFNRTRQKAERLIGERISLADGVSELLVNCSVILLVLSDAAAIRDIVVDGDNPLSGCTFIQMGTIAPEESRALAAEFASRGAGYLEAPVLGSIPEAKEGNLIVMVGGSETQFVNHYPIFQALGAEISHIGDVGAAAALKLGMNQLIGSLTAAFSVSLGFIQANNVPVETFMSIVRASALYAKTYDKKLGRMLDRDFSNPNFSTKHLLKDMRLMEISAAQSGVTTETLQGLIKVIQSAIDMGLADTDYSAIFQAIYKLDV